jgi:hypothetical protein
MKYITASLETYKMHESAFKNIWDSIFFQAFIPEPFLQLTGNCNMYSFLADGLHEPMDSEKLHAEFVDYQCT